MVTNSLNQMSAPVTRRDGDVAPCKILRSDRSVSRGVIGHPVPGGREGGRVPTVQH